MINQTSRFAFVDEGEALRRLGVDRDTLLYFVQEKRLRAYPGVGKGNFYKMKDLDALYAELHADEETREMTPADSEPATPGRKLFDPAYKVHVRLQADLKWYDLEDEDLQAWVRELHADGYARQRTNITNVIARLQRLIELMDQAAANWQVLEAPALPPAATTGKPAKPARKPLTMFSPTQSVPQAQPIQPATPMQPAPITIQKRTTRKPLPMAGTPPTANEPDDNHKDNA